MRSTFSSRVVATLVASALGGVILEHADETSLDVQRDPVSHYDPSTILARREAVTELDKVYHVNQNSPVNIVARNEDGSEISYSFNVLNYCCALIKDASQANDGKAHNQFCTELQGLKQVTYGPVRRYLTQRCFGGNDDPEYHQCLLYVFVGMQASDHYVIGPAVNYICSSLLNQLSSYCDDTGGILGVDFTSNGKAASQ